MAAAAAEATAGWQTRDALQRVWADPPWDAATYSEKGKSRDASRHYTTMPTDAIADIHVPAAPDSVLFLWEPSKCWRMYCCVMPAWGFDYNRLLGG